MAERIMSEHEGLAPAVGAWVAAEMRACMLHPDQMLATESHPANVTVFDGTTFCKHIDGMLDDLIELCALPALGADYTGVVRLIIVPHKNDLQWKQPDNDHEWQWGLCGYARIEKV